MQSVKKLFQPILLGAVSVCLSAALLAGCGNGENKASSEIWGQVEASETDMISKIPGYVDEMYFKEGQRVSKGQILAHIDARQLLAKEAEVNSQANAARAQAAQAKAAMDMALLDKERISKLYEANAVSKQMYDGANTKYQVALETYNQAVAGIKAYEHGVAQVAANIDDTYIKAPVDGIIATKYVNTGAMVSTGMPIYSIQNPSDNWINFKVPETLLHKFKLGQEIKVQGRNQDIKLTGKIVEISQKPDFATKRATSERGDATDIIAYNVKVQINDPQVYPGMRFKMLDFNLGE